MEGKATIRLQSWADHATWIFTVLTVVGLTVLGLVVLFSATQSFDGGEFRIIKKQFIWLGLALFAGFVVTQFDLQKLRNFAWVFYGISILGLLLVLIPGIGVKVNGSQRWLDLGPMRLQVSEFAKLGMLFVLAHYLAENQRDLKTFVKGFAIPMGIIGGVAGLVFLEPDFGTAFLCALVGFSMLFLAGVRLLYLIPSVILGSIFFCIMVYLDPVRLKRITAYLDVEGNMADGAYQLWQAILAFGAGGFSGVGLGQGRQQLSFLPEAHTDFIFAIVGEELGFVFTIGVVLAFLFIFLAVISHLRKSPDLFQYQLALGALLLMVYQALINIGVVTGCLPTKGMSLPFISYGGSNLLVMFLLVGLFVNMFRSWRKPQLMGTREL